MANLTGKGYGNRGSVFTFRLPSGKVEVYTSNAARQGDLRDKLRLPEGTKLVDSTSYGLSDGREKPFYVDVIWSAEGASHSGKTSTEYLLEIGAITQEQSTAILNAKTATL